MKIYHCKICGTRKNKFSGTRFEVRKHLREEHLIKSRKSRRIRLSGDSYESPITKQMIGVEI